MDDIYSPFLIGGPSVGAANDLINFQSVHFKVNARPIVDLKLDGALKVYRS